MTKGYGRGQITGLARLVGRPVGVIANEIVLRWAKRELAHAVMEAQRAA